ncbi:MAG: endonuclease/exonuclease/phosphatase family protein [Microlunatus sp.]
MSGRSPAVGATRPDPAGRVWHGSTGVRPGQGTLVVFGLLSTIPAGVASGLRIFPPADGVPALLASFIPYGLLFWLPAVLFSTIAAVRARRSHVLARVSLLLLALVTIAGLLTSVVWEGPAFVPTSSAARTEPVTVVSLNVRHGGASPEQVAAQAAGADVALFVEATPEWVQALPESFRRDFPHAVGAALQYDSGSVIFSRDPITSTEALPASSFQQWSAIVNTPQLGPVRMVSVHPCNPYCGPGMWTTEHTELHTWLQRQDDQPTVVAGDFNAVDDHKPMRELYADGWHSAANLAGAGFVRTYPADRRFPPLIGIDHILVNDKLTATSFETFLVPGTDHLGVRAVIAGTG